MKLEIGMLLRVQTKTKEDMFGDCLWQIEEVGLAIQKPGNPEEIVNEGVKCLLLGGSGPSAQSGRTVVDSELKIQSEIRSGISEIVSDAQKAGIVAFYNGKPKPGSPKPVGHGGTGVVDFN